MFRSLRSPCRLLVALWSFLLAAGAATAQDLEPKAYAASPTDAGFVVVAVSRLAGGLVFDPTVPLTDVKATFGIGTIAGGYTFGLLGKLALVTAAVPIASGELTGFLNDDARSTYRNGLADARFKLSVNLRGNDAMRASAFAKAPRRTIVGTSLTVAAPTGEYDGAKLINIGTNRWAVKPELGVAVPAGRWDVDAYAGVWLFTANGDFFPGGQRRTQEPVLAVQAHVGYTFRPRLWLAVDTTWYGGGQARVEGGAPGTGLNNSRLGATLSLPVGRSQSLKVAYSSGVSVRTGTDFDTLSVGWQKLWLARR
ncbi:hypothetical protein TBR22_A15020 [Luteitalea sp. TBR-22]|uniref:transporter n=1 Tax=Luteitalea sp. TBR-22 TaxID=2802971 RepID=UPI001AFC8A54|nr:transporter [Luteitalea sp. TBR-22]BCS32292.1 hypothetical protein TBR22_A15020 [Luteitalea sp. TBR-22]